MTELNQTLSSIVLTVMKSVIGPEFINSFLQEMEMKLRVVVEDGRKGVLTQQTVKKITSVKDSKNIKNILTRSALRIKIKMVYVSGFRLEIAI